MKLESPLSMASESSIEIPSSPIPFESQEDSSASRHSRMHLHMQHKLPARYLTSNYLNYLLFTDHYTRMTRIYPLKKKSSADVLEKFREYKLEVEKQKVIKRLRTDGGGKYGKWMGLYLKGSGIIHETTAPYSPHQNGVAERENRTIIERVKAIIAEAQLHKRLWMEIADTIVYLKNRSLTIAVDTITYELWHGCKPNLSHLKFIGSTVYIHVPKKKRTKLDTHSHKPVQRMRSHKERYCSIKRCSVYRGKAVRTKPLPEAEEPKIVHDSITVLPGPPEPEAVNFGILLQEPTIIERQEQATDVLTNSKQIQRVSARSTRGIITSKKFGDEDFEKRSGLAWQRLRGKSIQTTRTS